MNTVTMVMLVAVCIAGLILLFRSMRSSGTYLSGRPTVPVLVAFVTAQCPHCRACKEELDRYQTDRPCRVVDLSSGDDGASQVASDLGVHGVPAFFVQTTDGTFHEVPDAVPRTAQAWGAVVDAAEADR